MDLKPDNTPVADEEWSGPLILHVDMDAFFAAIEELDNPALRGKPVVVGADPRGGKGRGVVSTANYAARRFGIHSAMPISRAYRLCPGAQFVPPRYERYVSVSKQFHRTLAEFTPGIEALSIDEAFLDCTASIHLFGGALSLARALQKRIFEKTRLSASVGVAPNKFIAKVASDLNKPNGLTVCRPGQEAAFLAPLPVRRLWGAGPRTVRELESLGLHTIGDVAAADSTVLSTRLGSSGVRLQQLSRGQDTRRVETDWQRKSISEESTFAEDCNDPEKIDRSLCRAVDEVTRRMRAERLRAGRVQLKLRYEDFQTLLRSRSLDAPTDSFDVILRELRLLLTENLEHGRKVRLIGAGLGKLCKADDEGPEQLELIPPATDEKLQRNDQVLDDLVRRFGSRVSRAALLRPEKN